MAEPDGGGSVFEGRASFSSFKFMNVRTQGNTRRENDKTSHGPLSQNHYTKTLAFLGYKICSILMSRWRPL